MNLHNITQPIDPVIEAALINLNAYYFRAGDLSFFTATEDGSGIEEHWRAYPDRPGRRVMHDTVQAWATPGYPENRR